MKTKTTIDTVKFIANGVNVELNDTSHSCFINADGEYKTKISNRKQIPGAMCNHEIAIRSLLHTQQLLVEGALHGFLYGQNVHGKASMKQLVIKTLATIKRSVPFDLSDDVKEKWLDGDIALEKVDLAQNFRFKSNKHVCEIIRQIKRQFAELNSRVNLNVNSAYYSPQNGKKFQVGFYAKGLEVLRRSKRTDGLEKLVDEYDGVLRVEVRLFRSELKKLNLDKVSAWMPTTADEIFAKYFNRVTLINITSGPLLKKDLESISDRMRPVLALHKAGIALDLVYSSKSLQRHRKYFKSKGIDLRCQNAEKKSIQLNNLLSDKTRIEKIPKWMIDAKLVRTKPKMLRNAKT